MTPRVFATPAAFKVSLEQRLKNASSTGVDFVRRRQFLVFNRFLARLVAACGDNVVLKGGLALEFRLGRARTTKDIDLRMLGAPIDIQRKLQHAGQLELGDSMTFEVRSDRAHPEIKNPGMRYGGLRFRAECRLRPSVFSIPSSIIVIAIEARRASRRSYCIR